MKKKLFRLIAVLLALAPMAFAAACSQPDNSASGGDPTDIVEPGGDNPSEDNPSEDNPSEDNLSEEQPTKPTLPGGLVDGGNFEGNV